MIEEAKAGEYHDFKNNKYAYGKTDCSRRLRSLGYPELAKRIEQGEFDEQADQDDVDMMIKHLGDGLAKAIREM